MSQLPSGSVGGRTPEGTPEELVRAQPARSEPEFTVEYLDPRDLQPHPANFRRHGEAQLSALGSSLQENGWLSAPIVNRRTKTLLDGHARVELAVESEERLIPVRVIDVDEAQEKRILAQFDRIGSLADQDDQALTALLQELAASEAGLPAGWGEDDLAALLAQMEPESGLQPGVDPDALPEHVETRCKLGHLWQLGAHRLLCGDSTKAEDVARLMDGKRAPLMATDPPYGVGYDGTNHPEHRSGKAVMAGDQPSRNKDWSGSYREASGDSTLERAFLEAALAEALVAAPVIYQWHAGLRATALLQIWEELGLHLHQFVYWHKTQPVLTFSHFMSDIEPCMYGWREGQSPERRPDRNARQVWTMARDTLPGVATVHPTQKPVELFTRPMEWHTAPSEVCYEPFGGSGTAMIAAEQLGRACCCMEISPEFCDVILARYEQATGREAVRLE